MSSGTVQKLIDYVYTGQTTLKNRGQKKKIDLLIDMLKMKISLDEEAVSLCSALVRRIILTGFFSHFSAQHGLFRFRRLGPAHQAQDCHAPHFSEDGGEQQRLLQAEARFQPAHLGPAQRDKETLAVAESEQEQPSPQKDQGLRLGR